MTYSESMDRVLHVTGLRKSFKGRQALSGVDLTVPRGRVFGLLGPNGAGKSTLIRILCGLLRPDAGEAYILGWRVPNARIQSQIGYMPQETALYDDLTVDQNLRFFGELYDLPRSGIRERSRELLEFVQMTDRGDQRLGTLSGGMQRRVSLAVSLLHKPRLLFLDEPTSGVDPRLRRTLWDHFARLAEEDVTVLVTTHLIEEAVRCDMLAVLSQGRLLVQGTADEIRRQTGTDDLEDAMIALQEGEAAE